MVDANEFSDFFEDIRGVVMENETVFSLELALEGDVVYVVSHYMGVIGIDQGVFVEQSDHAKLLLQTRSETYHHVHNQVPVLVAKKQPQVFSLL